MHLHGGGVKLCFFTGLQRRVDVGFDPEKTGTEFEGFRQTAQINVTIDRCSSASAQFGLKVFEIEVAHDDAPKVDLQRLGAGKNSGHEMVSNSI
jgi:hypothetical protein